MRSADPPEQMLPSEPGVFLELQASSGRGQPKACTHTHPHTKSPLNHPHVSLGAPERSRLWAVYTRRLTPFQDPLHLKREANAWGKVPRWFPPPSSWGQADASQGNGFFVRKINPPHCREALHGLDNASQIQPKPPLEETSSTNSRHRGLVGLRGGQAGLQAAPRHEDPILAQTHPCEMPGTATVAGPLSGDI